MLHLLQNVLAEIEAFQQGASLQRLVNAVDALRSNSDLLASRVDDLYALAEEINAVAIYQSRDLNDSERDQVNRIAEEIASAIREEMDTDKAD